MKFTLEIELGNEEMSTYTDVASALRSTASRLEAVSTGQALGGHSGPIRDANGNTVGTWEVVE